MTKILCTLVLLFLGHSAFSSQFDLSDFSKGHETVLSSTAEAEEMAAGSEVEFSAGLQKDLHKIKIVLKADFNFFCGALWPAENISGEFREFIPNRYTAKIIYPFHSFP